MSVDATSIRESLFQRIASLAKGQPVTHPKMWGTICYCKSKMRRFPVALRTIFCWRFFGELKFGSWMTWWTFSGWKLRYWTSSALRARKRKKVSSGGRMLILKGVMLLVSEPVHCEENEVHHVHPMMCAWSSYWNFMDLQWFFKQSFRSSGTKHSFTYYIGFSSSGFWTMELKHDFPKKNRPFTTSPIWNTCSQLCQAIYCRVFP